MRPQSPGIFFSFFVFRSFSLFDFVYLHLRPLARVGRAAAPPCSLVVPSLHSGRRKTSHSRNNVDIVRNAVTQSETWQFICSKLLDVVGVISSMWPEEEGLIHDRLCWTTTKWQRRKKLPSFCFRMISILSEKIYSMTIHFEPKTVYIFLGHPIYRL